MLPSRQPEHEVLRETVAVALDGFVQAEGGHLVEVGQVSIEHDLIAADEVDPALDEFGWNREQSCGGLGCFLLGHER